MQKLRLYAQSLPITFGSWLTAVTGIVLIRIFLEQYSNFVPGQYVLIDIPTLVHYLAFYLTSTLALMCILLFFGKTKLQEVLAISLLGLCVICIAPIIDLVTGGIGGHSITYLFVSGHELFIRFITFFGGHMSSGITLGVQIETILGIIFCFAYVYAATKNTARAIAAALVFYCVIFFLVSIPSFIALMLPAQSGGAAAALAQSMMSSHIIQNNLNPNMTASLVGLLDLAFNKVMAGINSIFALLLVMGLFFIGAKEKFMAVIKNSRPERIFHFLLLFTVGAAFAHTKFFTSWIDVQSFSLAFLGITSAWMYSVCQNDLYDEAIDSISNTDRPLIAHKLTEDDMRVASNIFLLFSFLFSYAAGGYALFFTFFFLLIYFIYSNPPLRLKKFVIVNSFLVSLACLSVIMAGFFLISPDKNIPAFHLGLVAAIILFFTAVSNIRDLKDVAGDRTSGINTLPVLIGMKKSQRLIAGVICFFFLLIPWYFHVTILLWPSVIASILSWYFITQDNYIEWKGFLVYMAYLILLIGVLIYT